MQYQKPPTNLTGQIELLKSRGLLIQDEKKAAHYLSNISYYRLRAYTYPFQDNEHPNQLFKRVVSFEEIISLYVFDRKLRLLVFDALEKIEVALRTKIVYIYAQNHGSHWYEQQHLYRDSNRFIRDINKVYEEIDRCNETFIDHYKNKYTNPANPPAWMTLEVTSMGLLSKLFNNLKKGEEKKAITKAFGLSKPEILESWMHCFAHVRNICAHHGRLWNRRLTTMPVLPTNTVYTFLSNTDIHNNKLYATLSCITYLLHIISPGSTFNQRLKTILVSCNLKSMHEMGFPENWQTETIWRD